VSYVSIVKCREVLEYY